MELVHWPLYFVLLQNILMFDYYVCCACYAMMVIAFFFLLFHKALSNRLQIVCFYLLTTLKRVASPGSGSSSGRTCVRHDSTHEWRNGFTSGAVEERHDL